MERCRSCSITIEMAHELKGVVDKEGNPKAAGDKKQ